jgi:hypothetical protein
MPLTATADAGNHHFEADNIYFYMDNGDQRVRCGVSRLALEVLEKRAASRCSNSVDPASSVPPVPNFDRGEIEPDGRTVLVRVVDLL